MKRINTYVMSMNGKVYGGYISKLRKNCLFDLSVPRELNVFKHLARSCDEPIPDDWVIGEELPDVPVEFEKAINNANSVLSTIDTYRDVLKHVTIGRC